MTLTDTSQAPGIPAGFAPHFRKSPVTDAWEPLYSRRTESAVHMGLRLAKAHTNSRGLIHGGLIAALSDNAMGYSCAQAMGWDQSKSLVTIKPGEPYNGEAVTATTKAFSDYFSTFGYAFARVQARPDVDRTNNTVTLTLQAEPSRQTMPPASCSRPSG